VVPVAVVALVVAVATGVIHVFWTSGGPATTPASAIRALGTAANGHFGGGTVSFRYPRGWKAISDPGWNSVGHPTGLGMVGLEPGSEVAVETFQLDRVVQPADIGAASRELEEQLVGVVRQNGGRVEMEPAATTLAGREAFEVRFTTITPIRGQVTEHMIVTFKDSTECLVACVSTDEHAARIERGCGQVLRTLAIG
jgi:hypothetical protein